MKNSVQRKRTSSSTSTKANIHSHAPQINTRPACLPQMSNVFTSVPPLFGTAQAFLLRLAQLEAQLVLNLIRSIAAGNNTGHVNPLVPLSLLQPVGVQRSSFLSMYQPTVGVTLSHLLHRRNMDSIPHNVSYQSSPEIDSVTANGDILAKEIILKKTSIISKTNVSLPTSEEALVRSSTKHLGKHFAFKPDVDSSQNPSMTAKAMISPDRPQIEEAEPKQKAVHCFPTENLIKALTSLGLSLEDLELLSHFPDSQLTTEKLPFIIQDIQQRKETKDIHYGHARWKSSDHVESHTYGKHHDQRSIIHSEGQGSALPSLYGQSCPSSHSHRSLSAKRYSTSEVLHEQISTQSRTLKTIRDSSGSGTNSFLKRLQHGPTEVTRWRPGSVCLPSRTKSSIWHSPPGCNKTRHFTTKRSFSSSRRSTTSNAMRNGQQRSFPVKSEKSEEEKSEYMNIQIPVTKMTAKTSTQTKGVIRVCGISLDCSESELIKMAYPFSHPDEVLMATEVNMETFLEWKKALLILPTEFSAQEMVKVYSAIPVHMRQQNLELVSQTLNLSSPVSVFHAFVGPSMSNGLLSPLDHLLVVCNVPNQPSAATGVLRLLKPFGKVIRTLLFNGNKVDVDQCLWNKSSIRMVLEMESASVALSVYEWSQKIPCLYHNHHLSFLRGCSYKEKYI